MAMWNLELDRMHLIQTSTFGEATTYIAKSGTPAAFQIVSIASDVLRKEEANPGNFTFRFLNQADLIAAGCTPIKGDTLTISGVDYRIEQVQVDAGKGVHLMLLKISSSWA